MRKTLFALAAALVITAASGTLLADSPLTSPQFFEAYLEFPLVKNASKTKQLTPYTMKYLSDTAQPLAVKAAIINALSWGEDSKGKSNLFRGHLAVKYGVSPARLPLPKLNAHEKFALGYLTALDDYFHLEPALQYLRPAAAELEESYTANMILALTEAQASMDADWCRVWYLYEKAENRNFRRKDMRDAAIAEIRNYMKGYQEYCK